MAFMAYRELCHSDACGRIQEELWALLYGESVEAGWHAKQQGRCETLLVMLCDNEVHDVRKALGLPSGDVFVDQKEAYDSRCRDLVTIKLGQIKKMSARGLLSASAMMASSLVRVVRGGYASKRALPPKGLRQGKRLATDLFCCSTNAELDELSKYTDMEIGIDPPSHVLQAFHTYRNGSSSELLDINEVNAWWEMLAEGALAWCSVMSQCSCDDVRLALLNRACETRVGPALFVDDTRIKTDCRGHASYVSKALEKTADVFAGLLVKTCVVLRHDCSKDSISTTRVPIEYSSKRASLGYVTDDRHSGIPQMAEIEHKLLGNIPRVINVMSTHGLSMWSLIRYITRRTKSSALFPMVLLVHRQQFASWANALQDKCAHALLDLTGRHKRAVLMHEFGWKIRWSTMTIVEAIMMYKRAYTFDKYKEIVPILEISSHHNGTWATYVISTNDQMRMTNIKARLPTHAASTNAAKALLSQQKKTVVHPAAARFEQETWWAQHAQLEAMTEIRAGWTLVEAAAQGCSVYDAQKWAQLRIQNRFTQMSDPQEGTCRICKLNHQEDARHLLLVCSGTMPDIVEFCCTFEYAIGPSGGERWLAQVLGCCCPDQLRTFVELVGRISRAADNHDALPDGDLSDVLSDTSEGSSS